MLTLGTDHTKIIGQDPVGYPGKLADRQRVLDIQDNYGVLDDHIVPGKGVVAQALKTLNLIGWTMLKME